MVLSKVPQRHESPKETAARAGQADAPRVKRRTVLAKLDTLTQAIFVDMFGDPATNPKGWAVTSVGEIQRDLASRLAAVAKLKTTHQAFRGAVTTK